MKKKARKKPAASRGKKKRAPASGKKAVRRARPAKAPKKPVLLGVISHYFPHVKAAVFKVKRPLAVGDTIEIKGHTTSFKEKVASMQIDHQPIEKARRGQEIGLLVKGRVRINDKVYRVP